MRSSGFDCSGRCFDGWQDVHRAYLWYRPTADSQNTNLAQGDNIVKAIEIDMAKTGGDLLGDQLSASTNYAEFRQNKLLGLNSGARAMRMCSLRMSKYNYAHHYGLYTVISNSACCLRTKN